MRININWTDTFLADNEYNLRK